MIRKFFFISTISAVIVILTACTVQRAPVSLVTNQNTNSAGTENQNIVATNQDLIKNAKPDDITSAAQPDFIAPISDALNRITKKPFGIYVTPGNSPVQPEKFSGYHTGVDFETTAAEADIEVPITAACTGTVRVKQRVSGYGGVLIQDCTIDGRAVTVLYGHLNINAIMAKVGDTLQQSDVIGNLGTGYSTETDGERKHLHLGIHFGITIDYKGYVSSRDQLAGWLDAEKYL
ncbi:MAG: M23 family metallopeptidase [Patescibacteria group bacterium]